MKAQPKQNTMAANKSPKQILIDERDKKFGDLLDCMDRLQRWECGEVSARATIADNRWRFHQLNTMRHLNECIENLRAELLTLDTIISPFDNLTTYEN
jgi:hypothetical protein